MPQALADELGRIPLSRSLATTIVRAKDHASAKGHRLVTLEHLLLALIEDEEAAPVLVACKADLERLGQDVAGHLARLERDPPGGPFQPNIAPELKRIVEYAASAAQQGRRSQVDGAIVLAAMIGEGQSVAAGFLRAQELTFEDVVHTLQQQAQERAIGAQQNGAVPPSAEDIIASARERIAAASRGTGGRVTPSGSRSGSPKACSFPAGCRARRSRPTASFCGAAEGAARGNPGAARHSARCRIDQRRGPEAGAEPAHPAGCRHDGHGAGRSLRASGGAGSASPAPIPAEGRRGGRSAAARGSRTHRQRRAAATARLDEGASTQSRAWAGRRPTSATSSCPQ